MSTTSPGLSREASTSADLVWFQLPSDLSLLYLFGFLLFGAAVCGDLYAGFRFFHGTVLLGIWVAAAFGLAYVSYSCFRSWRASGNRIGVSETEIRSENPKEPATTLRWEEVATVKAHDSLQRLVLSDAGHTRSIRIEYQINNFADLRSYILSHVPESALFAPGQPKIFHANRIAIYIAMGLALPLLLFFWHLQILGQLSPQALLPLLFPGVFLVLQFLRPLTVEVTHDAVVLHFLFSRRVLPMSTITSIQLRNRSDRGNVWAHVLIEHTKGKKITLTRHREGSVALYTALHSVWIAAGGIQEQAVTLDPGKLKVQASQQFKGRIAALVGLLLCAGLRIYVQIIRHPPHHAQDQHQRATIRPVYKAHNSQKAGSQDLQGSGTIYFVQVGPWDAPWPLEHYAQWLREKYNLDVRILPAMKIDASAWDAKRRQYVGHRLVDQIRAAHPNEDASEQAFLMGFTSADMYSPGFSTHSMMTVRDEQRTAILSTTRLGNDQQEDMRIRRVLLKDIALMYWHLPLNEDPASVLYQPLDADLPEAEIYKSDLPSALLQAGYTLNEPCLYFRYSAKGGIEAVPGMPLQECRDTERPVEHLRDEHYEYFQTELAFGDFLDHHVDLYLQDTLPLRMDRILRTGFRAPLSFGMNGALTYDALFYTQDQVHAHLIRQDEYEDTFTRTPAWLSIKPWVRYESNDAPVHSVLTWKNSPYTHWSLKDDNGLVQDFMPCEGDTQYCFLNGITDALGHQISFTRDENRFLSRVVSPSGQWVQMQHGPKGEIREMIDSRGRKVTYSYDDALNLTRVRYSSGEMIAYEYDDTRHITTVRAAASDKDPLAVILQNEYTSGRLIRQILPGNRIYTYDYDGGPTDKAIHFTVHAPDGHVYHIDNQGVNPDDNPYTARETIADPGSNPHETKRSVQ